MVVHPREGWDRTRLTGRLIAMKASAAETAPGPTMPGGKTMKIIRAAFVAISLCALGQAFAQTPTIEMPPASVDRFAAVQVRAIDLGHDTYMLAGLGGNMTLAIGKDGAILVDTEFAPLHDKIKAAIGALTPLPVKYVIDTHYHGDHTGGNAAFAGDGAIIVAQTNVKTRMAEGVTNALSGAKTPPAPAAAAPTITYSSAKTLRVKGRAAHAVHFANAHTDGDTYVFFADANVLATGDIVTIGGRYPNIDIATGGSIDGMIKGVDKFLSIAKNDTKIVPGHGPVMIRADLVAYRANLVAARDVVKAQIKAGKTEDETVAAKPLAAIDIKVGATPEGSANFTRLVYRSLKAKR